MRQLMIGLLGLTVAISSPGCAPTLVENDGSLVTDPIGSIVAAAGTDASGSTGDGASAPTTDEDASATTVPSQTDRLHFTGSVYGDDDYKLFELGAIAAGSRCKVLPDLAISRSSFLVVLLDQDLELLYRGKVSSYSSFDHIVREGALPHYVGVASAYSTNGGEFGVEVTVGSGSSIPTPAKQVVWVNFAGGSDVSVHGRAGISFPSFDAAVLGEAYAGHTEEMKQTIVSAMRRDYAPYNVVVLSSDESARPTGPHAVIHVGGSDPRLLGLADHVDQYNESQSDAAMIYVQGFADFSVMLLDVEEMGQMIGNTASHELGHLLGLFHTTSHVDLMDTTGTAWDLVADQSFTKGPLEPSVFPTGYENSPARLRETVGANPNPPAKDDTASGLRPEQLLRKAELRMMLKESLRCRCGNCLNPDE